MALKILGRDRVEIATRNDAFDVARNIKLMINIKTKIVEEHIVKYYILYKLFKIQVPTMISRS